MYTAVNAKAQMPFLLPKNKSALIFTYMFFFKNRLIKMELVAPFNRCIFVRHKFIVNDNMGLVDTRPESALRNVARQVEYPSYLRPLLGSAFVINKWLTNTGPRSVA